MAKLLNFLAAFAVFTVDPSSSADDILQIYPVYKTYFLKLGATQELNCSVNTTGQNAKLTWDTPTMNGITRREETTVYSTKYLLKFSLMVENFSEENVGYYNCSLTKNDEKVNMASIILKPVEEVKTEPVFVREHKAVTLSCSIMYNKSVPAAEITWFKDGEDITLRDDKDRFVINQTLMTILNPVREDSGLYIAQFPAVNDTMEHKYDCEVEYKAGPLVLDFEKSKNIIEGAELELHCEVKGYPYAVITWLKDSKLVNDSRIILQDLDGHINAHFLIVAAEFSDAGNYSCTANSSAFPNATSSKFIIVRVKDKLAALWPFLGIVAEVVLLCAVIFIYEKRRSKQVQLEDNAARGEIDGASANKNEGLRHRNTNNPTA